MGNKETTDRKFEVPKKMEDIETKSFGTSLSLVQDGWWLMKTGRVVLLRDDAGNITRIVVGMVIQDCPAGVGREEFGGAEFTDFLPTSEKAQWRIKQFSEAAQGHAATGNVFDCDNHQGKVVCVRTEAEEYQGVTTSKVRQYEPGKNWARYAPAVSTQAIGTDLPGGLGKAAPAATVSTPVQSGTVEIEL